MKPWMWQVGVGVAIGILLMVLWRGDPSEEVQRLRERVAADSLRSVQTDSVLAARDSVVDSLADDVDSLAGEVARLKPIAAVADAAHRDAVAASQRAVEAIGEARTLADTATALKVALAATVGRAEAAERLVAATRSQLEATGRIVAAQDSIIRTQERSLSDLREDRDRIRRGLRDAMTVIGKLQSGRQGFLPALGRSAETVAVGAATVGACQQGVLTVGCIAGGVVTTVRLAKTI